MATNILASMRVFAAVVEADSFARAADRLDHPIYLVRNTDFVDFVRAPAPSRRKRIVAHRQRVYLEGRGYFRTSEESLLSRAFL